MIQAMEKRIKPIPRAKPKVTQINQLSTVFSIVEREPTPVCRLEDDAVTMNQASYIAGENNSKKRE